MSFTLLLDYGATLSSVFLNLNKLISTKSELEIEISDAVEYDT